MNYPEIEEFTPAFFDASSAAWRANKVLIGEGHFRYKKNAFAEAKPPVVRRSVRLADKAREQKKRTIIRKSVRLHNASHAKTKTV